MMLSAIASSEANHTHSYSLLNDTIGLPDKEYKAFQEYKEMSDKHNYLSESKGKGIEGLAREIACFSAFGEETVVCFICNATKLSKIWKRKLCVR